MRVELTGVRLAQARENLKKIRAIIRRIQNRGYVTLERIVTHLDHLAVGDEANAVIDATNAVSLMTVHASKGLEFPVVFVVNVSRGTGNWRDSIRIAGEAGDDVSVSVGDFESRADEDEPERDREETKRLLYVALTRARDRLYLGIGRQGGALSADARESRGSAASIDAQLVRRSGSRPDDCFVDRRIAGSCDARVSGFGRRPPGSGRGGSSRTAPSRGQTQPRR